MTRATLPHQITTDMSAGADERSRLMVLRGLLEWCKRNCHAAYQLTTTEAPDQGGSRLAVNFASADDAEAFAQRFAPGAGA